MKYSAYECDGCGEVARAVTRRVRRGRYSSYYETVERMPEGWVSLSVPGKRGHVCSAGCVDRFATKAVADAKAQAQAAFAKKTAPKKSKKKAGV